MSHRKTYPTSPESYSDKRCKCEGISPEDGCERENCDCPIHHAPVRRCPDCGAIGELKGHQTCQYPQDGFTLVELLIVVVIIGILAAIAIPNFVAMQDRAKEASTKANMHTFQLAAEDFAVSADGIYAPQARMVMGGNMVLQGQSEAVPVDDGVRDGFPNPFSHASGENLSWENRSTPEAPPTEEPGIVSYCSYGDGYSIKAQGKRAPLRLVLTAGGQ